MSAPSDLDLVRRVAGDNGLKQWLEAQKTSAVKVLVAATDPMVLARAQASYAQADTLLILMVKSAALR